MSHIARVQCKISDLDALEAACVNKNATLRRGATNFKAYYGTNTKCDHVITLNGQPNAYEVGLRRSLDGESYEMACDFYDGKLAPAFGVGLVDLQNEYLAVTAERSFQQSGCYYERVYDAATQTMQVIGRV